MSGQMLHNSIISYLEIDYFIFHNEIAGNKEYGFLIILVSEKIIKFFHNKDW